jgi:hypothetical protein
MIDGIAAEVDRYVPDLSRVDDHAYYDFVAQAPLRPELKTREFDRPPMRKEHSDT